MGIPGLNPYNIVLFFILVAWGTQQGQEKLQWKLPPRVNRLLILYLMVVTISFFRLAADPDGLIAHVRYFTDYGFALPLPSIGAMWKEDFFNAWKWLIPGLLICHGANSEERAPSCHVIGVGYRCAFGCPDCFAHVAGPGWSR